MVKVLACAKCAVVKPCLPYVKPEFFDIPEKKIIGVLPVEYLCLDCAPVPPASPCDPEPDAYVIEARARAVKRVA